jgi:hypothetical protein
LQAPRLTMMLDAEAEGSTAIAVFALDVIGT